MGVNPHLLWASLKGVPELFHGFFHVGDFLLTLAHLGIKLLAVSSECSDRLRGVRDLLCVGSHSLFQVGESTSQLGLRVIERRQLRSNWSNVRLQELGHLSKDLLIVTRHCEKETEKQDTTGGH